MNKKMALLILELQRKQHSIHAIQRIFARKSTWSIIHDIKTKLFKTVEYESEGGKVEIDFTPKEFERLQKIKEAQA